MTEEMLKELYKKFKPIFDKYFIIKTDNPSVHDLSYAYKKCTAEEQKMMINEITKMEVV